MFQLKKKQKTIMVAVVQRKIFIRFVQIFLNSLKYSLVGVQKQVQITSELKPLDRAKRRAYINLIKEQSVDFFQKLIAVDACGVKRGGYLSDIVLSI